MSERTRNWVYVGAIAVMIAILAVIVLTAPSDADRVETIGSQIKCPVCQGESIANSPAQMARDMMSLVSERVASGVSDAAIIDELLVSYSGAVLLDPPARGGTLILWLAPLAALVVGVAVIIWWRRHPTEEEPDASPEPDTTRRRALVGGLGIALVFGAVVVVAGFLLQDRAAPAAGVADVEVDNLNEVSNETMEAVIAANLDHPQINGMRLALAERYFQVGEYRAAFPHYFAVAESPAATRAETVTALVRLGWMAWDGNREANAAIGMFDQALAIDSASSTARYLKGQVLWCGAGDTTGAAVLFEEALNDPSLGDDSRAQIEADLEAVTNGVACA